MANINNHNKGYDDKECETTNKGNNKRSDESKFDSEDE